MSILTYISLWIIPFTPTTAEKLLHQHELRLLAGSIIGAAVFVLWVLPTILRISILRPLQQLLREFNGRG